MITAIIFGFAIFCGWLVFDVTKQKKLTLENVVSSLVVGVIGALGWWILDLIF
ncbi:hypothetical protein AB3N04_14620 [Alkalihalophilus sp. As8PL]|uniref:Uncharacterized protein n=1 Tax=Alkalihalophilus sp. As8PL TaxID=3237103 RepID=A0AB39BQ62_9BACI